LVQLDLLENNSLEPSYLVESIVDWHFSNLPLFGDKLHHCYSDRIMNVYNRFPVINEILNLLFQLFVGLPELKYLLQSPNLPLTMKRLTTMLRPKFSEEGSNANRFEKEVYQMFIKYLRELSGKD
jgi:hypothetical protein